MINASDLSHFTGTENYYKEVWNTRITDGVKYFMEACACNWLITDLLTAYRFDAGLKQNRADGNTFLVIEVKIKRGTLKAKEARVTVTVREDTNEPIIYEQKYLYSDLQDNYGEDSIKFYLIDGLLLLPSEY